MIRNEHKGSLFTHFHYSDQIQDMFDVTEYETLAGVMKGMKKLGMTAGGNRVDLALRHMLTKSFR